MQDTSRTDPPPDFDFIIGNWRVSHRRLNERLQGCNDWTGRPIRVRFLWRTNPGSNPTWEQAFSADGGTTWETNWTMEFERL
jgi:hypothetical protein